MTDRGILRGQPVRLRKIRHVRTVTATSATVGIVDSLIFKNDGEDIVEVWQKGWAHHDGVCDANLCYRERCNDEYGHSQRSQAAEYPHSQVTVMARSIDEA